MYNYPIARLCPASQALLAVPSTPCVYCRDCIGGEYLWAGLWVSEAHREFERIWSCQGDRHQFIARYVQLVLSGFGPSQNTY